MSLEGIDWGNITLRAGGILALWLFIWILRRLLIRWLHTADRHIDLVEFDDRDIKTLTWIIDIVLVVIGLGVTISILGLTSILYIGMIGPKVVALAAVWIAVWVLVRYLSKWIEALDSKIEDIDIDPRDLKTMDRLLDWLIIAIGIVASLAILEISSLLYSALTAAGVLSVMIGFAVKDVAANLISGIFILIDQPFVVGDVINIKDYSGTVNKISLRSTEIITFDGPVVTIPNSTMAVEPTTNYTLSEHRRVLFTVSVLNSADLNLAIKTIQEILDAEERLLPEKAPSILVNQIRDYAVDFQIVGYTRKEDVFTTQSDLQKEIVATFGQQGIELAVPLRMNLAPSIMHQTTYQE